MTNQHYFIGFPLFEEFLAASPTKTIYLTKSIITRPNSAFTQTIAWNITAAAVGRGVCHYWRMPLGNYDSFGGEPFPEEKDYEEKCSQRCCSAMRLLTGIARRRYGFRVIRGLIAFPPGLTLLSGTTKSIRYDKNKNLFEKVTARQTSEKLAA